ncbi:MAG: hypothetical protein U0271_37105 [Polyangiaceae bacterium]
MKRWSAARSPSARAKAKGSKIVGAWRNVALKSSRPASDSRSAPLSAARVVEAPLHGGDAELELERVPPRHRVPDPASETAHGKRVLTRVVDATPLERLDAESPVGRQLGTRRVQRTGERELFLVHSDAFVEIVDDAERVARAVEHVEELPRCPHAPRELDRFSRHLVRSPILRARLADRCAAREQRRTKASVLGVGPERDDALVDEGKENRIRGLHALHRTEPEHARRTSQLAWLWRVARELDRAEHVLSRAPDRASGRAGLGERQEHLQRASGRRSTALERAERLLVPFDRGLPRARVTRAVGDLCGAACGVLKRPEGQRAQQVMGGCFEPFARALCAPLEQRPGAQVELCALVACDAARSDLAQQIVTKDERLARGGSTDEDRCVASRRERGEHLAGLERAELCHEARVDRRAKQRREREHPLRCFGQRAQSLTQHVAHRVGDRERAAAVPREGRRELEREERIASRRAHHRLLREQARADEGLERILMETPERDPLRDARELPASVRARRGDEEHAGAREIDREVPQQEHRRLVGAV